jgi:hypothetical protein
MASEMLQLYGPPLRDALPGDPIEHKLMPGFVMVIAEAGPCENGPGRDEPHSRYRITDPYGTDDWLCGYDVRPAADRKGMRADGR